jgi:serine phosphatase RsbU (regulator of sigma subunit)
MDISVLVIDAQKKTVSFAAAKHPLYLVRNGEITEIKGSKFPIGSSQYTTKKQFDTQEFACQTGDVFYLCSDGYQDQFGDHNKGKFMKKKFRELLLHISSLPMPKQADLLKETILAWQGNSSQTDDWLVMGLRF